MGWETSHVRQIFDGLRHAVHPAQGLALRQLKVTRIGLGQQCIGLRHAHNGIALRVVRVDLIQVRLHDLAARHLSGVNGLRQFAG